MYIKNLKQLREKKGKTQIQCAEETGVPIRSLQRYENGCNIGDTEYLCRLMEYYDLLISDLSPDSLDE